MNIYKLPSFEISCAESYDVIVVGGGPAGCTAAVVARSIRFLGGTGTSALVPASSTTAPGSRACA